MPFSSSDRIFNIVGCEGSEANAAHNAILLFRMKPRLRLVEHVSAFIY